MAVLTSSRQPGQYGGVDRKGGTVNEIVEAALEAEDIAPLVGLLVLSKTFIIYHTSLPRMTALVKHRYA